MGGVVIVLTTLTSFNKQKPVITFPADSCVMLLNGGRRSDGLYNLRIPDVVQETAKRHFRAWCDMTGPNGGWLVFQQRINGSVNFKRDWFSYAKGFGRHGFEFWLGNDYIHGITSREEHVLRIEISSFHNGTSKMFFFEYDNFRVSSPFSYYTLHVGKYQGNLSDILLDANNSAFSTWDRDYDQVYGSCAQMNKGAWWYGSTCDVQDLNSMLGDVTAQGLVKITMKTKKVLRGKTR